MFNMVVTLLTSQDDTSLLKDEAPKNIAAMFSTLLTFHDETFSLNVLTVEQYE